MAVRKELPCVPAGEAWYEESPVRLEFGYRDGGSVELCKVYITNRGRRFLLGTPMPQNGALALRRSLSKSALIQAGVYPPERVEVERAQGQAGEEAPPRFADSFLAAQFRGGGWRRSDGGAGFVLCHTWRPGQPVPACPLFCFATLRSGEVRYCFDRTGRPVFPLEE